MGISVYISSASANTQVKGRQKAILDYLKARKIEFETIDLCLKDVSEEQKQNMPEEKRPEKDKKVQAPQVFNGDDYCGDYDMFDNARELGLLCTFFKMPPTTDEVLQLKALNMNPDGSSVDPVVDKENDQNLENNAQDVVVKENVPKGDLDEGKGELETNKVELKDNRVEPSIGNEIKLEGEAKSENKEEEPKVEEEPKGEQMDGEAEKSSEAEPGGGQAESESIHIEPKSSEAEPEIGQVESEDGQVD